MAVEEQAAQEGLRCNAESIQVRADEPADVCVLSAGHGGMHVGMRGTAWSSRTLAEDEKAAYLDTSTDPLVRRMVGTAYHPKPDGTPFDVPYMSEILPGFWQGGCENGLVLPEFIQHVVSLYPWEQYTINHKITSYQLHWWHDDEDLPSLARLRATAQWVAHCLEDGPTLVHCQAGLNRSSLLAAATLVYAKGMEPAMAVLTLRDHRSPACLCNPYFQRYVLSKEFAEALWP